MEDDINVGYEYTKLCEFTFEPYSKEENADYIPFVYTGKIYYNICPSKRAEYETKSKIQKEGVRENKESKHLEKREREREMN